MERFLAWYAISSSIGAVVALSWPTSIPLVGVLFFGWTVWTILIVYWLENGIVGVFNVLKMREGRGRRRRLRGRTGRSTAGRPRAWPRPA